MNIAVIVHSSRLTRRDEYRLAARLGGQVHVYRTRFAGHAEQLARVAIHRGADTIVVAGGDGTIHETYRGIGQSPVRLAIIPRGTANDLATSLRLPHDVDRICDAIIAGQTRTIDVMYVNAIPCLTVAALGLPVQAVRRTRRWRSRDGLWRGLHGRFPGGTYLRGLVSTLLRDRWPVIPARIFAEGSSVELRITSLIAGKLPVFGRCFKPLPQARPDDGMVHCCWFDSAAPLWSRLRSIWRAAWGSHLSDHYVSTRAHREVTLSLHQAAGLLVDGELYDPVREISFTVVPRALPVVVAATAEVRRAA